MSGNGRVTDKEQDKVKKYQDLTRELRKFWNTSLTVALIVVEALRAVCNIEEELIKLNINKIKSSKSTIYNNKENDNDNNNNKNNNSFLLFFGFKEAHTDFECRC